MEFCPKEGTLIVDFSKLRRVLLVGALCIAGFLAGLFLLPLGLPFLIGTALAWCVHKPVETLKLRTGMPRWLCSMLCLGALFLMLGFVLYFLIRRLVFELGSFAAELPTSLAAFAEPAERIRSWLNTLAARLPDGLGVAMQNWLSELFAGSSGLVTRLTDWLIAATGAVLGALPDILLFAFTAILSSFMISSKQPALQKTLSRVIPKNWQKKAQLAFARLRDALGGWIRAQLMLMLVTFGVITAGLFILRLNYALLFGALIALIDALPIFGAGTILVPWGLIMFLRGSNRCGIGLILLYGISALVRSTLEPKLIGKQLGLDPLLTLFSMYAGFRLFGLLGLIIFPIAAILIRQIVDLTLQKRGS